MSRLPVTLLLVFAFAAFAPAQQPTDDWGNVLYPSQHGAPAGYPGCFDDKVEQVNKETGQTEMVPKYPVWGFPQIQNYPGSVEHYFTMGIKYQPALNPFNAESLVKKWDAPALPGIDAANVPDYAEPISYMPMYGLQKDTGRRRAPVKVLRLKPGGKGITVPIGTLKPGTYALRIVAAVETAFDKINPEPLVITCRMNSGTKGETEQWTRRHRAADEFYQIGEWYFHAWDNRELTAEIRLDAETAMDVLLHTVDVHDALVGCPLKIVKKKPTLYPIEERKSARATYVETGKLDRSWGSNITTPRPGGGLSTDKPLAPAERAARDEQLWSVRPPATVNLMQLNAYGQYDTDAPDKDTLAKFGTWEVAFQTRYARNWDRPVELVNKTLNLKYTMDDFLNQRPLPDPYPVKARGYAVKPEKGYFSPILNGFERDMRGQEPMFYQVGGDSTIGYLPLEYYYRNNYEAARDAAFILARMALTQPATITAMRRSLQQVVCRWKQCWDREPILRRTFVKYPSAGMMRNMRAYDALFDFIDGNTELAAAVGRFIPWIKTPDDLRAFLDQRLLMLPAREMTHHRMGSSHGTPVAAIAIATAIGDREASRPVMEWLFTQTWDYPLPVAGIEDYISTVVTRDGTTTIGSFAYTAGGSPLLATVAEIDQYIKNGGDPKYNLADPQRYPKPFAAAYFNIDARVAGTWAPGVGDVGGPTMDPWHWWGSQENAVRAGWKYMKDPKLAYVLKHYFGPAGESDKEWAAVEKAAAGLRNPWMSNRSRVLSAWNGILESGTQHDDYRFRRAATVRVGVGWGHSHRDTLDLQIRALGCIMSGDGGQRPNYGRPDCTMTLNHNVVEVDNDGSLRGGNWEGHAYIGTLADMPGAPMLHAKAIPPLNKRQVKLAERTVAVIDVHEGQPSNRLPSTPHLGPGTVFPKDVVLPASYVLDVYRVSGGKRHTYGFHGCSEDTFDINVENPRAVKPANAEKTDWTKDPAPIYLRKYALEGHKGAGVMPKKENLVATWRLGREPYEFDMDAGSVQEGKVLHYKCGAPEQGMMRQNYDPASPRKYTRLHLLGHKKALPMWGKWVSAPYTSPQGLWFTQLHVMEDGDADRDSVFTAVIEPYAGDPFIKSVRELDVAGNETDALRAVAVEVTTTNGHRDVLFADGRPETPRRIGAVRATGRFAAVSTDADGLRLAGLVGGAELDVPKVVNIKPVQAAYEARITRINHLDRRFDVDAPLPQKLINHSFLNVGNDKHRTSLEILDVKGSQVRFRKGLDIVTTRVVAVDEAEGVVTGRLVSILMGTQEDNGMTPGMTDGLWATNDAMTKWWKCTYTGGTRQDGYTYKLTPVDVPGIASGPVTKKDFPLQGALRIWELGPTDTIRLETFVNVRRFPLDDRIYEVTANVPCRVGLPADKALKGYEMSSDRVTWTPIEHQNVKGLWQFDLTEKQLETDCYLRPAK